MILATRPVWRYAFGFDVDPIGVHDTRTCLSTLRAPIVSSRDALLLVRLFPVNPPGLPFLRHLSQHLVLQGCEHVKIVVHYFL
jgi:hypothetical protein